MNIDIQQHGRSAAASLFVLMPEHVTEQYVAWLNDPEVNQYLESRFARHTLDTTREYVAGTLASPVNLFLGIRSVALGKHVGNIKLGPINEHYATAEIGIMIGDKQAWGRGIATAAIDMVSNIALNDLGLRKVTAGCYESNVGSKRAFERAGFVVEGRRAAQVLVEGKPEGLILMGRVLR